MTRANVKATMVAAPILAAFVSAVSISAMTTEATGNQSPDRRVNLLPSALNYRSGGYVGPDGTDGPYPLIRTHGHGRISGSIPHPVATIPVDAGTWVGAGNETVTISNVSDFFFTLKWKGKKRRMLYTLVGSDAFRGADGSRFVVTARGRAIWGNTRMRLK